MKAKGLTTLTVGILFLMTGVFAGTAISGQEEGPDVYDQKVRQLTTLECAQCHYSVFADIRDQGGAHKISCRKCHEVFHASKPGADGGRVLPTCETCHSTVHEGKFSDCTRCHANVHAPVFSIELDKMIKDCQTCHHVQAGEIKENASAHAEMSCIECHADTHGYVPECTACHDQPHTAYKDNAGCTGCHPVHAPLRIEYAGDVPSGLCGGCHSGAAMNLSGSGKGHAPLNCVFCHAAKHRFIPTCQDCHGNGPHDEKMLQDFEGCLDCHGDAHRLQ